MNILMLSKSGDGLGIAHKLVLEGHNVRVWIKEQGFDYALLGLVERVTSWRPSASSWADFIFSDMVGFGKLSTSLDTFDKPYLGFNQIGDLMELDRAKQMDLFRKFNIRIPETEEFENPEQARSILDDWTNPGYVIKASGNIETGKTYVVRSPEIYNWALDQFSGDQDLIVQRIVEGIEISTEGWFDGKGWLEPFNHTIEYKRFLDNNLGPNTGCMGNIVWAVGKPQKDKFVQNLKKLTPFLQKAGYKGPIDFNTIATSSGIFALEVTARFGYDAIEALYELFDDKILGDVLFKLGNGESVNLPVRSGEYALAVRLSVPPYPHGEAKPDQRGLPILGVPKDFEHFYPTDVFLNNGLLQWSASDGVLLKVGGSAKTIDEVRKLVYKRVKMVKTEGLQYRTDLGADVPEKLNKLRSWGHLPQESLLKKVIG